MNWSDLTINGTTNRINYDYDSVGNLTLKDDYASTYSYGDVNRETGNAGPNAVHQISLVNGGTTNYNYDNNGNLLTGDGKTLSYNAFNKPLTVSKNGVTSNFYYGSDQMRYKQVKTGRPNGDETTFYVGGYEEIRYGSKVIKKSYLGDTIVTETVENSVSNYQAGFVHRDRLNSVVTVTDDVGNVIDNKSYDPFGKPRKATMELVDPARLDQVAWTQGFITSVEATELPTRQGFTGHEHIDDAELVHMNGRIYDYNLGRFLSVDPFIQSAGNSQSINPYSYIMNNPLSGTDPSGYISERRDFLGEVFGVSSPFDDAFESKKSKKKKAKELKATCKASDTECINKFLKEVERLKEQYKLYTVSAGVRKNGSDVKQPKVEESTNGETITGNRRIIDNFKPGTCATIACLNNWKQSPDTRTLEEIQKGQDELVTSMAITIGTLGFGPLVKGLELTLSMRIVISSSGGKWGTLSSGVNQGVKHFLDKSVDRLSSLEKRLGVDPGTFDKTLDGFKAFTEQAQRIVRQGISREVNGKTIFFRHGEDKVKKGVVVIMRDGKIQSMMPGTLKSFNKLK